MVPSKLADRMKTDEHVVAMVIPWLSHKQFWISQPCRYHLHRQVFGFRWDLKPPALGKNNFRPPMYPTVLELPNDSNNSNN
jgi:hypothetical protein